MDDDLILAALARIEAGQNSLRADMTTMRADLMARMDRLQDSVTSIRGDIITMRADMDAMRADMDAMRADMDTTRADMTTTRADMTTTRADLMARMDRLQDSVTSIREDIITNYGAAQHAQRINDNTRAEQRSLNDLVQLMQRQILRLQTDIETLKDAPQRPAA